MEYIVVYIYIIISMLFTANFINIIKQLHAGSKKVTLMSLLATSSLVLQFASLAYFFYSQNVACVLITQIYMVLCMLYIKLIYKKDKG